MIDSNGKDDKKQVEKENDREEGRPLFYNFWGKSVSKWALIFILLIFLAMISLKMCDSPYVVPGDPSSIKIIE